MRSACMCLECCLCGRLCSFLCSPCDGKPMQGTGNFRRYTDPPSLHGAAFTQAYQATVNALSAPQQELFYTLYEDWARSAGGHASTDGTCPCLTLVDIAQQLA